MDDRGIVGFDLSMLADVFTVQEEIANPKSERRYVVILGAGASRAAFPIGDRNGQKLPVIKDFVGVVGLTYLPGKPRLICILVQLWSCLFTAAPSCSAWPAWPRFSTNAKDSTSVIL